MTSLLLASLLVQTADATYTLALETQPRLRVRAELALRGDDDGSSSFSAAPSWGGVEHCARFLHELAFFAEPGTESGGQVGAGAVPVELAADHPLETAWIVAHPPGARLVARWYLDPREAAAASAPGSDLGNDYRPLLRPGLFQLIGETGLLLPDSLKEAAEVRLRLDWKGFAEAGWQVACSFGDDPAGVTVEGPLGAFAHAVFLAGDLELHSRAFPADPAASRPASRLLFAFARGGFGFEGTQLADLATRIITAERDFFSDWSDPLFVVTLVPDERTDRRSSGGTGLTDSFALFLSPGMRLEPGKEDAARIALLLAHEHFHHWNGGKIKMEEPEQLAYWFSEGFTDFFARRILLRCGLFDVAEYARRLNESLEIYWRSPHRHEKNARIAADFWKVQGISDLPYRRGDLVALLLDHEIRAVSAAAGDRKSLDDFFRDVLVRVRERGEVCSTENLLELAADWTSAEFAARLRALIVDGADIELDPELGAPWLRLGWRNVARPAGGTIAVPFFALEPGADLAAARGEL